MVVVVDFNNEFVDFGCGDGMMFDFFFFYGFDGCGGGNGGCCGYGLVVRCLNFFFPLCLVAMVVAMVVVVAMVWWYGV